MAAQPTVRALQSAMVALHKGRITPDEFRRVMRASRESRSEQDHHAAKAAAAAQLSAF